jgi:integrase
VKDATPAAEKHERCPTDDEFEALLNETERMKPGGYRELFLFLGETGLRIGEALHVRWCDLHFGQDGVNWLRVEPHGGWEPKTKSSVRTVPISPRVEAMLRARLSGMTRFIPTERVFATPFSGLSAGVTFNAVLVRLGLHERDGRNQKLRVHSLRHYYATRLVRSGADPASVRDLLGHTSINVTNRYFNVPRGELFRAVSGAFGVTKNVTDSTRLYTFPQDAVHNRQETAISEAVVSQ